MGALLAIPPSVDIDALGLSTYGKVIARAAQDYGVYVVDRGGSGITFLAEYGDPDIQLGRAQRRAGMVAGLEIIRNQLQRVTNNSTTNRGGGGTPRVPLASHPRRD